jgi:hypothetical protein
MFNLIFGLGPQEIVVVLFVLFLMLVPVYFMAKVLLSEKLPTDKKILWLAAIFFLSYIGLIIFLLSQDYRIMKGQSV